MSWKESMAQWLAPERERRLNTERAYFQKRVRDFDMEVNSRVADIILKMDPLEPFLKKYHVVFSEAWDNLEDKLDSASQTALCMWAHGVHGDPYFKYLTEWIINTQGNSTLRKAKTEMEWFYGRASIATIALLTREIGRLSERYKETLDTRFGGFDKNLAVES